MPVPVRKTSPKKKPPLAYNLRALGKADLPPAFDLAGIRFTKTRTVKHDFFAATGFYESEGGQRVVLKIGRTEDYAGLPMRWLGRFLCNREMRFYKQLADLPAVPRLMGKYSDTGLIHDYAPGRPLAKNQPVPDGFFAELEALLNILHTRGVAYVDTNKPQNILLGEDSKPKLIDFQISFDLVDFGDNVLTRWLLRRLQREDLYHIRKHRRRMRPDELTPEQRKETRKKSGLIWVHRIFTRPYFLLRRRTFKRLRDSGQLLPEGSK